MQQSLAHLDGQDETMLVAKAQAGDGHAFGLLLNQYNSQAFGVALRITNNREDAEDVLQESLINAYRRLSQFRGDSRFSTWLVRIVTRQALTALRRRSSRREVSLDDQIETAENRSMLLLMLDTRESPEMLVIKSELRQIVFQTIDELDTKCRVVLMLRELGNLSIDEVARVLELSVAAAKARLFRARQRLLRRLTKRLS